MGRYRATPVTNIILDSLGVVDEEPDVFAGARDPMPKDLRPQPQEYLIQSGDFLRIRIFELFSAGIQWEDNLIVNDTGRITLPVVGSLIAKDLTELELTEAIENLLVPDIIRDPQVGVVVVQPQQKIFTIQGNINGPGSYQLTGADFRISKAFAFAGGIPPLNSDYAYVIRTLDEDELYERSMSEQDNMFVPVEGDLQLEPPFSQPGSMDNSEALEPVDQEQELLDSVAPMVLLGSFESGNTPSSDSMVTLDIFEELDKAERARNAQDAFVEDETDVESANPQLNSAQDAAGKAVRQDGQWTLGGQGNNELDSFDDFGLPSSPDLPSQPGSDEWGFDELSGAGLTQEVIRINLKKLRSGDPTQNIVLRPGDDIHVPANASGLFYVYGQVSRPGPYNMSGGQKMTLRQAVLGTAGPLSPTAWPSRCEITRRIGDFEEVTARVNLEKIIEGTAPDYYIKPGDQINIGSHPVARWIAVIRQSFRATYGFGFVYDRNFADKDFGN